MSENAKNYFFWNEQAFERALKEKVCSNCFHCDADGICQNPKPSECAFVRYLPDLVRIAQHLKDPSVSNYISEVSSQINLQCQNLSRDQSCDRIDSLSCGLKRLLPYALEAILETDSILESRNGGWLS